MATDGTMPWKSLERYCSTAFRVGAGMFVVAAALTTVEIVAGAERLSQLVGQAFIAAGWTATTVGLLGLYPGLVDRSRWLARAGALFAAIGIVGFVVVGVAALAFYARIPEGSFTDLLPVFAPFVFLGTLLPYLTFSIAILRTGVHSWTVGVLVLAPAVIFVVNVLTPTPPTLVLVITSTLALVHFTIGHLLRAETRAAGHQEADSVNDPSAG